MDIALALDGLVPAAQYRGSVTENTREAYDALIWLDVRSKPSWGDAEAFWESSACQTKLAVQRFDCILFQTDLASLLPTLSNPNLRWEFAALNTYATNRDFGGLVWYINMLYAGGVATVADVDAVMALLSKQNINPESL